MRFFAPRGEFPPCGMFTLTHFIVLIFCIAMIIIALYYSRGFNKNKIRNLSRLFAVIVTILEIIKIGYNHYYRCFALNYWFPLAFCSLFIYSLWLAGFAHGKLRKAGETFLVCGGIVAGFAFLIMPSTSLTEVPMFHYLSCYSMLFHSLMLYFGLLYLIKKIVVVGKKELLYYIVFCLIFGIIAFILNDIYKTNLMFLSDPYNIPIKFLKPLSINAPVIYSLLIFIVYITFPYLISLGLSKLLNEKKLDFVEKY